MSILLAAIGLAGFQRNILFCLTWAFAVFAVYHARWFRGGQEKIVAKNGLVAILIGVALFAIW